MVTSAQAWLEYAQVESSAFMNWKTNYIQMIVDSLSDQTFLQSQFGLIWTQPHRCSCDDPSELLTKQCCEIMLDNSYIQDRFYIYTHHKKDGLRWIKHLITSSMGLSLIRLSSYIHKQPLHCRCFTFPDMSEATTGTFLLAAKLLYLPDKLSKAL